MEETKTSIKPNLWIKLKKANWEKFADWFSHFLGAVFGIVAITLLPIRASATNDVATVVSTTMYGISIFLMFLASTIFHFVSKTLQEKLWKKVDHSAIFLLILGSFAPLIFVAVDSLAGYILWWTLVGASIVGIIIKIFFAGKFKIISTFLFIFMGWSAVFIMGSIYKFSEPSLWLIIASGATYTIGALIYAFAKFKFHHFIWHLAIIAGVTLHFIAIFGFIIQIPQIALYFIV